MAFNAFTPTGPARLIFQLRSATLTGNLGGRFLYCMIRSAEERAVPPAGDYQILPPGTDPIYGRFAVMVRAGGSGAGPRLAAQVCFSAVAAAYDAFSVGRTGTASGDIFVLSAGPVFGRNNIVVNSGFAELMDALQTGGGARVTVA